MPDAISSDELDRLVILSEGELFGELGKTLEASAIECLNQALIDHGGKELIVDGTDYDMDDYIDLGKLKDVLIGARKLAEKRNITVPQTISIESVVTDNEAIRFIMGT